MWIVTIETTPSGFDCYAIKETESGKYYNTRGGISQGFAAYWEAQDICNRLKDGRMKDE